MNKKSNTDLKIGDKIFYVCNQSYLDDYSLYKLCSITKASTNYLKINISLGSYSRETLKSTAACPAILVRYTEELNAKVLRESISRVEMEKRAKRKEIEQDNVFFINFLKQILYVMAK